MGAGLIRFLRIVAAYALVAVVDAALKNLGLLSLPFWAVPLVAAALNALARLLREWFPDLAVAKIL